METFSALPAICAGNSSVPGEFTTQRPVTRTFDLDFDLRPNKRLSKQSWGWWFETPLYPLWRHCNDVANVLTQWGRVTHICVSNLTTIGSDNGLSPDRRQPIIWTSAAILLIGILGTKLRRIVIETHIFLFEKNAFEYVIWKGAVNFFSASMC